MKKNLLLLIALFLAGYVFSQDTDQLKPGKGTLSTELNVNPFNGEISFNNSVNQIKLRYFTSDLFALRFGFNVRNENNKEEFERPYGTNPVKRNDERKSTNLSLNFGVEKHFNKSKRISPYIGTEVFIENFSVEQESVRGEVTTTYKNAWYEFPAGFPTYASPVLSQQAYSSYGLNVFTGFDFYISGNFFFGYELSLGFTKTSFKEPETEIKGGSSTPEPEVTNYEKTSFSVGPRLLNGIRLGFNF